MVTLKPSKLITRLANNANAGGLFKAGYFKYLPGRIKNRMLMIVVSFNPPAVPSNQFAAV